MNQQQLKEKIKQDWVEQSSLLDICLEIIEYLISRPIKHLRHLTYSSLKIAVKGRYSDVDMLAAIQYLSGDAVAVLSLHFEFIDEYDESFDLDCQEVSEANKEGRLVHPRTGKYIENYKDKVLMYFTPGNFLKQIEHNG